MQMSGAAAVILTAYVVGRLRPEDVEVHFVSWRCLIILYSFDANSLLTNFNLQVAPACENMVSEKAIHPGDIVAASNGKTVELMNVGTRFTHAILAVNLLTF